MKTAIEFMGISEMTSAMVMAATAFMKTAIEFMNEAAAVKLQGTDYHRWVFANEPEWQEFQ